MFATRQWEAVAYEPFPRNGFEAEVLASLIGGLMFLSLAGAERMRMLSGSLL